ncbi:MAG: outer membrane beta-barrel protein [Williamsia sp.]|nr:outer membrane beta-barrel protein [Williamsia sp.]
MKKWLLFSFLMISAACTFAQISKGQWLVGGSGNFNYSKTDVNNFYNDAYISTTLQLSPGAGYFFLNNLAAGLRVNARFTDNHISEGITYDQQLSLSPFMRYYFLPQAQKLNLFVDGAYAFGRSRYRFKQPPANGSSSSTTAGKASGYSFSAGPVIFLNPGTALEFTVNYTKEYGLPDYENSNRVTIMGGVGLQVHLGN